MPDIRTKMFGGISWFDSLRKPTRVGQESSWYLLKDRAPEWDVCLLKAALRYAERRGLWDHYRVRFEAIPTKAFLPARIAAENRTVVFPIWEIANELVVAAYLEHVLGWAYRAHEPIGCGTTKGDWEFETRDKRVIFVEVKSLKEPPSRPTQAHSRPSYAKRLADTLRRAYDQLPSDRATLVVLVGNQYVRPFGQIFYTDLFAALFGQFILEFPVDTTPPRISYAGPSLRQMFLGREKNRKLSAVSALAVRGAFEPGLLFYSVHNPFAVSPVRLNRRAFANSWRVVWDKQTARVVGRPNAPLAWKRMRSRLLDDADSCSDA